MKVAIIGAGIAGLTAAQNLKESGVGVQVFEKSRGLGGRLCSKRLEWGSVDIGAQYFTARDPEFKEQVEAWQQAGAATPWRFTPHIIDDGRLTTKPDTALRYVATPKMNSLAHAMSSGFDIRLRTRVTGLVAVTGGWRLGTESGLLTNEVFDWVIVALPAEQAKQLLAEHTISTLIPPAVHLPCWALAMATRGKVQEEVQGIFGDDRVSWVSRLTAKPGRQYSGNFDDVWMLHFSSEVSRQEGAEVRDMLPRWGIQWLYKTLGGESQSALKLVHSYSHFWRYARVAESVDGLKPFLIDREQGLAVAGDWCCGGRVEGAYLSAKKLVKHILA